MKVEKTNITRQFVRVRLFKRWAVYLRWPIEVGYLPNKLGGIQRKKYKWSEKQKKEMSNYMKNDWKRRKLANNEDV